MNFFESLIESVSQQTKEQHKLFVASLLIGAFVSCAGLLYYFYMRRAADIATIQTLQEQSRKNDVLLNKSRAIQAEADRVQALLENNQGFSIKTFFESLTQEQKLKPEPGWETETHSIEGNDTFDEIALPASFKNQTTQTLVSLLGALEHHEIVYIKELEIKKEGPKNIGFQLTIATKKRKQIWED